MHNKPPEPPAVLSGRSFDAEADGAVLSIGLGRQRLGFRT
jgi:hypothetical protein